MSNLTDFKVNMQEIITFEKQFNPIALRLRRDNKTQIGLWRQARGDGKPWGKETFTGVCAGWIRNTEIEDWLKAQGLGDELKQAQMQVEDYKKAKQKEKKVKENGGNNNA